MASHPSLAGPDTPIVIKITINEASIRKFKLPLKELGAGVLLNRLRQCLDIAPDEVAIFERFSDSAGGYIVLDQNNPAVFKTLVRAAKAKLKLRLKATVHAAPTSSPPVKQEVVTSPAMDPVIVSSGTSARDSTALDGRSIGSGIFQFREARASQQTLVNEEHVPQSLAQEVQTAYPPPLAFRTQMQSIINSQGRPWSVFCNECDGPISNGHFHCSICDGGDYDLCEGCVSCGKLCPGEGHWLIKRFINDGKVISSTTERISPRVVKPAPVPVASPVREMPKSMPATFTDETKAVYEPSAHAYRTCNNCVATLPEAAFVSCTSCEDFDLCTTCHERNEHGHHPAHAFKPGTQQTILSALGKSTLAAGRNVRHNAICDGCEAPIFGVRHKCMNCPDWDYCNTCVANAHQTHPRHRFAALYEPIPMATSESVRHYGIYCDGPLCNGKGQQVYISGVRYKCAVCHDTDFCAACEALPVNHHNRTHPLIKFKTPVKNVNVSTENQDVTGNVRLMGDRHKTRAASVTSVATQAPAPEMKTTQCLTVADIKPVAVEEKKSIVNIPISGPRASPILLNAHFQQDSIADGTRFPPGVRFTQVWTLRNPGPHAWPAGCSVRYVGGDNMLNVDNARPVSVADINEATESNVVGRVVEVGENVAFKVTLKSPQRFGKAISYWRVKAADGTPFGHRLWCDIEVSAPPTINPVEHTTARSIPGTLEGPRALPYRSMQLPVAARPVSRLDDPSLANEVDKLRKEAARQRMERIKMKILKAREERDRFLELKLAGRANASVPPNGVKPLLEDESKTVPDVHESQMVFPKLDKESPASSTYMSATSSSTKGKAAWVEGEDGEVERTAVRGTTGVVAPETPAVDDNFEDLADEIEVLSAASDSDDDDGFLTDEEYDILDASDRETVASP